MFRTWPASKERLMGVIYFLHDFQVKQFCAFKWLCNRAKCHRNGAKIAIFFTEKSQKSPARMGVSPPNPCLCHAWVAPIYAALCSNEIFFEHRYSNCWISLPKQNSDWAPDSAVLVHIFPRRVAPSEGDVSKGHNWSKIENISEPTQLIFEAWNAPL